MCVCQSNSASEYERMCNSASESVRMCNSASGFLGFCGEGKCLANHNRGLRGETPIQNLSPSSCSKVPAGNGYWNRISVREFPRIENTYEIVSPIRGVPDLYPKRIQNVSKTYPKRISTPPEIRFCVSRPPRDTVLCISTPPEIRFCVS